MPHLFYSVHAMQFYRLTQVVPEKKPLNVCVCVCVCVHAMQPNSIRNVICGYKDVCKFE